MDVDFDFFDSPKGPAPNLHNIDLPEGNRKNGLAVDHGKQRGVSSKESGSKSRAERDQYRSSSPEYSSDESFSDEEPKPRRTIEAKLPKMKPIDHDLSDHSDFSESGRRCPTPDGTGSARDRHRSYSMSSSGSNDGYKNRKDKNAWGKGTESKQTISKLKPKGTQMGKKKSDKERKRADSYSSDDSYVTDSDTDSGTDSDVTDVSPLNSPQTPFAGSKNRVDFKEDSLSERARIRKPPVSPNKEGRSARSRPISASSSGSKPPSSRLEHLLSANQDSVDMKLLLQAVIEMDKERGYDVRSRTSSTKSKPKMYKPQGPAPQPKKNYSFSNDSVRTIDLENQRLMQKIMVCANETKKIKAKTKSKAAKPQLQRVPTTSSINRQKEQMRIEGENQAFLRRLQGTGATKHVQRDKLIKDYNSTMLYGYSVAAAHENPSQKSPKKSPYECSPANTPGLSGTHAKSMSSLLKSPSTPSSTGGRRSRPASATVSRPQSGTARSGSSASSSKHVPTFTPLAHPKQAWEDRW